uniref:FAF domain-containing protein n=1 Tax=Oryza brachyantha TaxID=4533 RepID=J3LH45_ORYBR
VHRSSCRGPEAPDCLGLRSLLVADAAAPAGRVVTRTMVATRVQETTNREGECSGGCIDEEEGGKEDGDDGNEGYWVAYGRRGRMRRLPPPLPSLRAALRRTRTEDGRLVIPEAPAGARPPEYIRARRCGGRLTLMKLVERNYFYPCPALAGPSPAQEDEDEDDIVTMEAVNDTSTAGAVGEGVRRHRQKAAAPPPLPGVGCFEDVIKYHPIESTSLHRLRMVH